MPVAAAAVPVFRKLRRVVMMFSPMVVIWTRTIGEMQACSSALMAEFGGDRR
jgi:hypothetical protein